MKLYQDGNQNKQIGENSVNMSSSRSHTMFIINILQYDTKYTEIKTSSQLVIVDLAGSER